MFEAINLLSCHPYMSFLSTIIFLASHILYSNASCSCLLQLCRYSMRHFSMCLFRILAVPFSNVPLGLSTFKHLSKSPALHSYAINPEVAQSAFASLRKPEYNLATWDNSRVQILSIPAAASLLFPRPGVAGSFPPPHMGNQTKWLIAG